MASHRRPKQPSRTRVTVLTATAAAAVALTSQTAHADPKPSKTEVKAEVDKLYEEAEKASEKYNGAKEKQDKLEGQIGNLQDKVARGQEELNELRQALGSAASAQYRTGGIDPSLQLFLSADPDDYLDKASALDQLSSKQAEGVKKIQAKQRDLAQQRQEAQAKLQDLSDTRKELGDKKKKVQGKLADAQKLLNSLTAAERAELQQEEERASRSMRRPCGARGRRPRLEPRRRRPGRRQVQGRHALRLGRHRTQLVRLLGPHLLGLRAGRSTPSRACRRTRPTAGTRIGSQSALKPGDLVIFYSDLHHVGFYAGNGQVLHAPKPGANVRYESINNMPYMFGVRI